jgi:hypothetical protein
MMRAQSPAGIPAAVAFGAELVLQGPDDGLDPPAAPVRERARLLLVLAGGTDQGQSQAVAGEELPGALSGQALVRDDGGAGRGAVRRLAFQGLPGLVPLAVQLRVREAEPGDGPAAGADDQLLGAPVPARMARAYP